jgi:hypothetical protein
LGVPATCRDGSPLDDDTVKGTSKTKKEDDSIWLIVLSSCFKEVKDWFDDKEIRNDLWSRKFLAIKNKIVKTCLV